MLNTDDVESIVRKALGLPSTFVFKPGIRPAFVAGWDSVGWVKIIVAIENQLGKDLHLDIIDETVTVDDFFQAIKNYSECLCLNDKSTRFR